jgi:hypothetical protein
VCPSARLQLQPDPRADLFAEPAEPTNQPEPTARWEPAAESEPAAAEPSERSEPTGNRRPPELETWAQPPQLIFADPPPETGDAPDTADRPTLVFIDPPEAEVFETGTPDPDRAFANSRDGTLARIASQASAFAERIPDQWPMKASPTLVGRDDAVARGLSDVQSPALTVLFALVVIAAVLLFVYLVTPLLR